MLFSWPFLQGSWIKYMHAKNCMLACGCALTHICFYSLARVTLFSLEGTTNVATPIPPSKPSAYVFPLLCIFSSLGFSQIPLLPCLPHRNTFYRPLLHYHPCCSSTLFHCLSLLVSSALWLLWGPARAGVQAFSREFVVFSLLLSKEEKGTFEFSYTRKVYLTEPNTVLDILIVAFRCTYRRINPVFPTLAWL